MKGFFLFIIFLCNQDESKLKYRKGSGSILTDAPTLQAGNFIFIAYGKA